METQKDVLNALDKEALMLAGLLDQIEERGWIIPAENYDQLRNQAVIVANVIKMIKDEGIAAAVMALVATYPFELFEANFTIDPLELRFGKKKQP